MNRGLVRGDHPPLIPPWMGGGDPANDGFLLGYDTSREGAAGPAQALVPSGKAGATAYSAFAGGTTSGAPTVGQWNIGEFIVDRTGAIWICTSSGAFGTATLPTFLPGGSGVELAEAELASDPATFTNTLVDISGLSITLVAPSRSFIVDLTVPEPVFSVTGNYAQYQITDSANIPLASGYSQNPTSVNIGNPVLIRARLPRSTGAGAYAITAGTSYTFKVRGIVGQGSGASIGTCLTYTSSGSWRPILRAVTC